MRFSFIHISDHHLLETETSLLRGFSTGYALKTVIHHIDEHFSGQIDFLVTTGDIVDHPSLDAYHTFGRILGIQENASASYPGPLLASLNGLPGLPVYSLPGNHDDRENFYRALYPQTAQPGLANAAFQHKGAQFILLDVGPEVKASFHPETIDFLARALQAEMPAVLMLHHHIVPIDSRWLDAFLAEDAEPFWQALAGRPVLGIFCGHTHITYEKQVNGIPIFGIRSTALPFALQDDPLTVFLPPQYRLVTVENNIVTTQVIEVPL